MQNLQFHDSLRGQLLSRGVELRTWLLHLPYGDQGLLVHQDTLEVGCCHGQGCGSCVLGAACSRTHSRKLGSILQRRTECAENPTS